MFCFLAFTNSYNLFDGINLQIGIYSFFIFVILYIFSKNILIFVFFYPLLIFLILNSKGKIFLGNSGSYFLSFVISYFFISIFNNFNNITSDQILAIMFLPGVDMIRLFIVRILNKKSPFAADKNHINHKFLKIFSYKRTILFISMMSITPFFANLGFKNYISFYFITIFYFFVIYILKISIKSSS